MNIGKYPQSLFASTEHYIPFKCFNIVFDITNIVFHLQLGFHHDLEFRKINTNHTKFHEANIYVIGFEQLINYWPNLWMKQPYGRMSTKRVPPMSTGATNTLSPMWPTNFTQIFGKEN